MSAKLVVGSQWGDEGKAKIIDFLSKDIDIIARFQGGANAGHTVQVNNESYIFHLIPSGILYPGKICVIGNGVVLDFDSLQSEIDELSKRKIDLDGRLLISDSAQVLLPHHRLIDEKREIFLSKNKIGTTKRGIGTCYSDKMMRIGLRVGELLDPARLKERLELILEMKNRELKNIYDADEVEFQPLYEKLLAYGEKFAGSIINTSLYLNNEMAAGKKLLLEGAQGTGLDVDFGTYPYVTSSNTTTGGAISGSGISFQYLKEVIGISKAYVTRVGEGYFPTELLGDEGEELRQKGAEFGATTGRPRRCGWFDAELLRHAARVNGLTSIALTKLDILSSYKEIKIGTGYHIKGERLDAFPSCRLHEVEVEYETMPGWESDISNVRTLDELPPKCRAYIDRLVELMGVPISFISVGKSREMTIVM